MRLTQHTDYAIRVLMYAASRWTREGESALSSIHEIAAAYGISENHLMKVVHRLAQEGLLHTQRGRNGGGGGGASSCGRDGICISRERSPLPALGDVIRADPAARATIGAGSGDGPAEAPWACNICVKSRFCCCRRSFC